MNSTINTQAIALLTKLVSIPSPSHQEAAAATYLVEWLNQHGFTAQVDAAGNAVGLKGQGGKEILLLGHIDTFPGEVPVRQEGELLYGRGAVDAKGPLCTFVMAALLAEVAPDWRITVVGAVEEEAATSKGARHILAQRQATMDHPVYCIIGEPSHWDRITLGYKGRLLMQVGLRVPFSHSAGPERLPAEQAVDFWRTVEQHCATFNQTHHGSTPFTMLDPSLRHIVSQDVGTYGQVDLSLGFRLPVGLSPDTLEQQLRSLTSTLPDGTSAELRFSGGELAYKGNKSNPLVRAFLKAIRAAQAKPRFVTKTGTADMNVVGPHWPDTPIVAYGPGDSTLDHTPHEHLDLNEYVRAIDILKGVLTHLMQP